MKTNSFISLLFIIQLSVIGSAWSQPTYLLKGIVKDSITGKPIEFVTVSIQGQTLSTPIVAFTTTDDKGAFDLSFEEDIDSSYLRVSLLGYKAQFIKLRDINTNDLITVMLIEDAVLIKEVVIKSTNKIIQKTDTLTYSADAFRDSTERNLEELIAKLPGIDVSKDGKISINGKEIKKILIDGDDMSGKNYQLMSQNLSALTIDKIQVIDRFLDDKLLKGLKETDDQVINVTFKKEVKNQFLGSINLGIGNSNKHNDKLQLVGIFDKFKSITMFDYNTIGESPINSKSDVNEQDVFAENRLINSNSSKIIDINGNGSIPLNATYNRFNKAIKASTRFVLRPYKKVKITSWLNFDKEKVNSFVDRNIRYRLNNSILEQVEENIFSGDNKNLETQTTAQIDLNDKSSLQILSNFYSGLSQKKIASTINNANFQYNLIGNTNSLNNKITYINRFNEVCALSFDFVSFNHKRNQVFGLMSNQPIKSPFIDSVNFTGIEQHLAIPMKTMGANLQLLYSKASHQFAFNSGIIGREENVLSNLNEYRIDSFQNDLLLTNKNYYLGFNWKKQFKNFAFFFKGTLGKNQTKMKNFLILNKTDTSYGTYYALPTISLVLRKPKLQFLGTYNYNYGLPQLIDLYSGYILTSNRTFSRGTYHYAPSNSHTLIFNYRYQDLENFDALTNFYINSTISVRTGAYQSSHQIDDYFNIVDKKLNNAINSNYSLSGGIERYFPKLLSTIKLKPSFSYLTYQNVVNNTSNRQNTYSIYSLDMTMRSGFSSIFNFAFGVKPFISQFKTIRTDFNNKIFTKNIGGYFDMYFNPSKKLNFRFENEFYTFRNSNQKNQSYFFANAYLDYRLIKSNVNIRLQCRNVLNTKSLVNNYTTDFLDTQSRIKLIPRFLLLEFDFNF